MLRETAVAAQLFNFLFKLFERSMCHTIGDVQAQLAAPNLRELPRAVLEASMAG